MEAAATPAEELRMTTSPGDIDAFETSNTLAFPVARCEIDDDAPSGPENVSDNDGPQSFTPVDGEQAEEVVGFSIGQAQNYMRSATTPAAVKSQAIDNNAGSYFDIEPLDGSGDDDQEQDVAEDVESNPPLQESLPHQRLPEPSTPKTQVSGALPPPWKPGQALQHRSAATRAFLADGFTNLRRRASSGPSALSDNVRKLVSELPSLSLPNFGHMLKDDHSGLRLTGAKRSGTTVQANRGPEKHHRRPDAQPDMQPGLDGNISSTNSLHVNSPNAALHRSTSDSSLYLRRGLSHTTTLDDTSKWDNVSEQVNSRFKAIADSFQDTRFRLPRVPSINFSSFRSIGDKTEGDNARGYAIGDARQVGVVRPPGPRLQPNESIDKKFSQAKSNTVKAESRAHPIMAKALESLTGDIIVIGGYRGSILRSAKPPHRQLWVPVKVGLNLRKVNLEVGLTHEDEERMEETIFASGVLSHIGPVDICRRLLRHLQKCPNAKSKLLRVHDYGYDWRLSPHLLSRRLLEFVEKLPCNQADVPAEHRGVTVIAHSLGGLITRHVVNLRPELFAGVVYAGVPQRCVNILGPLRNGDAVLLSSRVLTAQVNFTMRTSFALLPEDGKCFVDKETGERYDLDFFDVKTWEEYRLSPCIRPPLAPEIVPDHRKSLIDALSDSLPPLPSLASAKKRPSRTTFATDASHLEQGREQTAAVSHIMANRSAATAANAAVNAITNPPPPASLEPSMAQSSSPSFDRTSVATACTIPHDDAVAYLRRTLHEVRTFKRELAFNPAHQSANTYPPLAYMFAKSTPTVYGARVAGRDAIKTAHAYDDLVFAAGDGVVLASAAAPPSGYRCVRGGRVETDRGHVGLLGDIEGVGRALQAIREARAKGIGLGTRHRRRPE